MFRKPLLALALLVGLLSTGCMRSAVSTQRPDDPPAASQPSAPVPVPQPDTPAAPVSSTLSVANQPWLTAPAAVGVYTEDVRIAFSAPVDRASVEAQLKERLKDFPYAVAWQDDQALTLTPQQGCAHLQISVAGALDARGNRLGEQENPTLTLGLMCEGSGYRVVTLPDGKPFPGFPQNGVAVDTHAATGRLLGRNGTIYFLVEAGQIRPLTHTVESNWARFMPDSSVVLSDGTALRQVAPDGKELRKVDLPGKVLTGALSPDRKQALLMLAAAGADATAGFVQFDLDTWTASPVLPVTLPFEGAIISWPAGADWVAVWPLGAEPWLLDPQTGSGRTAKGLIPLYSADSRYALFASGQVVEVATGKEVANIAPFSYCPPPQPWLVGSLGAQLIAAFSDPCH